MKLNQQQIMGLTETRRKRIYRRLEGVFGSLEDLKEGTSYRAEAEGFMRLSFEVLQVLPVGDMFIGSLSHYGVQNGDLMADPDMEILFMPSRKMCFPMTFRNDYMGFNQQAAWLEGEGVIGRYGVMREQEEFLDMWTKNIEFQGHKLVEKENSEGVRA